jgi:hypothetical protein
MTLLLIIVLVLLLCGGGGYLAYPTYGYRGVGGILVLVLVILLIAYLVGGLRL